MLEPILLETNPTRSSLVLTITFMFDINAETGREERGEKGGDKEGNYQEEVRWLCQRSPGRVADEFPSLPKNIPFHPDHSLSSPLSQLPSLLSHF